MTEDRKGAAGHRCHRRPPYEEPRLLLENIRWCSDALKFTCRNGEIVRVAFGLECHDREVIGWLACDRL